MFAGCHHTGIVAHWHCWCTHHTATVRHAFGNSALSSDAYMVADADVACKAGLTTNHAVGSDLGRPSNTNL